MRLVAYSGAKWHKKLTDWESCEIIWVSNYRRLIKVRQFLEGKSYLKAVLAGVTAITLPTFYQNLPIPKVPSNDLSDGQKLLSDYRLSLLGIRKEVQRFEKQYKRS